MVFVCTPSTCDVKLWGYIHYYPNLAGNALFMATMIVLAICQTFLAVRYRTRSMGGVMLAGLATETLGYVARILLNNNPFNRDYFLWYLITLTIGPVFIAASIYLTLGRIVIVYGEDISRLKPKSYTNIFIAFDILSLVVQAVGGGIAASYPVENKYMIDLGTNILIAGLSIQVAGLFAFTVCSLEFLWRVRKHPELRSAKFADLVSSKRFKLFLYSLFTATALLFIRTVFRSVELSEGFAGDRANDEVQFMVLDGVMVILATVCLSILHPGFGFQGRWQEASFRFRTAKVIDPQEDIETVRVGEGSGNEKQHHTVSEAGK